MIQKKMLIEVGQEKVVALLLEDKAPETCKMIWQAMPLEGPLMHAKICRNECFFITRLFPFERENMILPKPGDIGIFAWRQSIAVWYDETEPLGPNNIWAKIVHNLGGFQQEARKLWTGKQGTRIRLSRLEG